MQIKCFLTSVKTNDSADFNINFSFYANKYSIVRPLGLVDEYRFHRQRGLVSFLKVEINFAKIIAAIYFVTKFAVHRTFFVLSAICPIPTRQNLVTDKKVCKRDPSRLAASRRQRQLGLVNTSWSLIRLQIQYTPLLPGNW